MRRPRFGTRSSWCGSMTGRMNSCARWTGGHSSTTRGLLHSGVHGAGIADAKAEALHQYRDEEWRARIELSRLRATETGWHLFWRVVGRRRRGLELTAWEQAEPFLQRWREPVTRHVGEGQAGAGARPHAPHDGRCAGRAIQPQADLDAGPDQLS